MSRCRTPGPMAATDDPDGVIARALQTARELTGMDLAFVGHFDDGREIIRHADGDEGRFGMAIGHGLALEGPTASAWSTAACPASFPTRPPSRRRCRCPPRPRLARRYLGVPCVARRSLYGTFCCIARDAQLDAVGAAQRAQSAFFTAVTHDVRTPLTVITGYAEELVAGAPSPEVAHDWAQRILRNAQRLDGLLGDVLLLARAEAGALEARREPVDLGALVGEAVGDAAPAAYGGDVRLQAVLPGEPVTLEGDAGQLRRVVDNLVSNAVKYSPAGGPVDVRVRAEGPTAVLEVSDHGIGIPAAEVDGLGLSISRSIVAAHEGTIALESEDGAGTTVRVRLPLARR